MDNACRNALVTKTVATIRASIQTRILYIAVVATIAVRLMKCVSRVIVANGTTPCSATRARAPTLAPVTTTTAAPTPVTQPCRSV